MLGDVVRVMLLFYLSPVWSVIGGRLLLGEAASRVTHMEAGRSGVILLAELLIAVVSATLIGGEQLAPREWVGGALITAAALLEASDAWRNTEVSR